jgi:hypothetical protein
VCCARAGRARDGTRVPAVRALAPGLARGRLARARSDGRALAALAERAEIPKTSIGAGVFVTTEGAFVVLRRVAT